MDKSQLEAITLSFTETFNDNDLDAMMSYFAEEAAVYDQHNDTISTGLTEIRAAFEPQFAGNYGEMQFETEDLLIDPENNKSMISWLCSFDTKRGRAGWRGLDILHFNSAGKITNKLTYAKAKVLQLQSTES